VISTGDMKRGATIELDGRVWQVLEFEHIKMGRGSAQMRMKMRDVRRGDIVEKTFQAGEKWPRVRVERVAMQFSYADGNIMYFMNTETYDQVPVSADTVGDAKNYLPENGACDVLFLDDEVIGIELPASVVLKITKCEPGVKGDTAQGATKPATTETGLVVNVPLFINEGDKIRVNTSTGLYQERA
jgi:elongation factor P